MVESITEWKDRLTGELIEVEARLRELLAEVDAGQIDTEEAQRQTRALLAEKDRLKGEIGMLRTGNEA